jgi:hypothetical protein
VAVLAQVLMLPHMLLEHMLAMAVVTAVNPIKAAIRLAVAEPADTAELVVMAWITL